MIFDLQLRAFTGRRFQVPYPMATDSAATGADRWDRGDALIPWSLLGRHTGRTAERRRWARVLPACATRIEAKFVETALSSD